MTISCSDAPPRGTLLISREEVGRLLGMDACIAAVEEAFRLHAEGRTLPPAVIGVPARDGGFHVKAAGLVLSRTWFAVKCNGNFAGNGPRHGMPRIQGLITLCDGGNGYPLAVMDSTAITALRTGAATAVAARHLARRDARVATIVGCGVQGRVQARALSRVRAIERVFAVDIDPEKARCFATEIARETGAEVVAVAGSDLAAAVSRSDICVTCTPSRRPLLTSGQLPPGLFIAAVGADSHDKQELDPRILSSGRVVADILDQCAAIGELHHALEAGVMTRADVHAELADVVTGRRPGRTADEDVIVFDSTGTALQDAAAAVAVYEAAGRTGAGVALDLIG